MHRYHLFETAHGHAAIGWNTRGVTSFRLPAARLDDAERALRRRLPDAVRGDPAPAIAAIVAAAQRYFTGVKVAFDDVAIEFGEQSAFFAQVYAHVRAIGWGERTTYGAVAKALGAGPAFARDVGQAMAANPVPLIVPCHRVLAAGGKVGGFSAPGGARAKARMLAMEGYPPPEPPPEPAQAGFAF